MKIERVRKFVGTLPLAFFLLVLITACKDDDPKPLGVPVLADATELAATSFKVSWGAVTEAEKYLLDVSTKSDFSTTVSGYSKKEVTGTNAVVNSLTTKTKYYFRVYSKKGTQVSTASSVKEATTL